MANLKSICVYLGANAGAAPVYAEAAEALGSALARERVRLVYGGGAVGLMGILARATLAGGGEVTGIIPQFLRDREIMLHEVTNLVVTEDMHERKRLMFQEADAFVALPGGIGTLEEVVEVMTWAQLDRHAKPILIVNVNGFWDPLVALFRRMTDEGFLHKSFINSDSDLPVTFVDGVEAVVPTLRAKLAEVPQPVLDEPVNARL
jgi:hypothetical protein